VTFRELSIPGAWEITPTLRPDPRGRFFEWFTDDEFTAMTGHSLDLRQANVSVSAAGVLRGLHFAQLPPSQAKYVTCVRGAVFDVVVDVRVGSATFGQWDSVLLDDVDRRAIYLSEGLGHAFVALTDHATVSYLVSDVYSPTAEHGVNPLDPQIALRFPAEAGELILSDKDADAPSLAEAEQRGLLPQWDQVRDFYTGLSKVER